MKQSHASIRRLRAEVLNDCISQVTETKDKFQGLPRGARAVQIADGATFILGAMVVSQVRPRGEKAPIAGLE